MLRFAAATVSNTPRYSFWTRALPSQQHHRLRWASRETGEADLPLPSTPPDAESPPTSTIPLSTHPGAEVRWLCLQLHGAATLPAL